MTGQTDRPWEPSRPMKPVVARRESVSSKARRGATVPAVACAGASASVLTHSFYLRRYTHMMDWTNDLIFELRPVQADTHLGNGTA
ncbi:jg4729 [Pararge aegeria aegeria]|uniref:Jg4729 protein n=1 Tax=Pararge aegeria aegeria TaxID=348720 RepID=A0A8S4RD60_9NEOP|nr:jg4729 [Pararge aegeria aegeria]